MVEYVVTCMDVALEWAPPPSSATGMSSPRRPSARATTPTSRPSSASTRSCATSPRSATTRALAPVRRAGSDPATRLDHQAAEELLIEVNRREAAARAHVPQRRHMAGAPMAHRARLDYLDGCAPSAPSPTSFTYSRPPDAACGWPSPAGTTSAATSASSPPRSLQYSQEHHEQAGSPRYSRRRSPQLVLGVSPRAPPPTTSSRPNSAIRDYLKQYLPDGKLTLPANAPSRPSRITQGAPNPGACCVT